MTCRVEVPQGWTLGVFAAVIDESGRILVSERTDGKGWNLPGGRADPTAPQLKELAREVLEETGLTVAGRYVFLGSYPSPPLRDVALVFAVEAAGVPTPSDEANAHAFVGQSTLERSIRLVSQTKPGEPRGRMWAMTTDALRAFQTNHAVADLAYRSAL